MFSLLHLLWRSIDWRVMKKYIWGSVIVFVFVVFSLLWWQGNIDFRVGTQSKDTDFPLWSEMTPLTGDLLISPYGVENELLDILAETKYSVSMRNYLLTEKTFLSMFANLSHMWVEMDIILENEVYGGDQKAFLKAKEKLGKVWARVLSDEQMWTNFVHAKTLILDKKKVIISTANFTYPSLWRNREYRFITSHTWVLTSLENIFAKDLLWEEIFDVDIHPRLLICPIDCREKIVDYIENAQQSIQIEAQYIEDPEIIRLLEEQISQGLRVELIVGAYQEKWLLDAFGTGAKVLEDPYIHAKNILIDGKTLLMWSMNLSTNALDNNREIGIIIDDEKVIKKFHGQFIRDWKA